MALLKHLNKEKSAHAETPAMQYLTSQPDPTTLIPFSLNHPIIRPALLLILLLFSSFSALAEDCEVDGIYYYLNNDDKTASVTYADGGLQPGAPYKGNIVIPQTIRPNNVQYSVSGISNRAFEGCTELTSITIPNSITRIENSAFKGCTGLTSVVIPNSVTRIDFSVFEGCANLTSINIPNGISYIPSKMFSGCGKLAAISIPSSVTSIGSEAFRGCTELSSVTIPESITIAGDYVFRDCTGLISVAFNAEKYTKDSTGSIFTGCSALDSLTIGKKVTTIPDYIFKDCTGLVSVTIPEAVTYIGKNAFSNCI